MFSSSLSTAYISYFYEENYKKKKKSLREEAISSDWLAVNYFVYLIWPRFHTTFMPSVLSQ